MNAADRNQVQTTERHERNRGEQQRSDLKAVLATAIGRRVFGWLIDELQPPENVWHPNASTLAFNAARYDVGSWIRKQIGDADADALVVIAVEARAREKQEALERTAAQTKRTRKKQQAPDDDSGAH